MRNISIFFAVYCLFAMTPVTMSQDTTKTMEKLTPIGSIVFNQPVHFSTYQSGIFSPDGRYFVASYGKVRAWTMLFDTETGKNIVTFEADSIPNHIWRDCTSFSPDSKFILVLHGYTAIVWDIANHCEVNHITFLDLKKNDRYVDKDGKQVGSILPENNVYSFCFSDDGKQICGCIGSKGYVWDIDSGALVRTIDDNTSRYFCFSSISPDFSLQFFSESGLYYIRDLKTEVVRERNLNFCIPGDSLNAGTHHFSNDKKYFVSRNTINHALLVWDAETGSDICTVPVIEGSLSVYTFLPDNKTLVTVSELNPPNHRKPNPSRFRFIPTADQIPKPIPPEHANTILEFWDIRDLVWDKHQANVFPKKIKACYFDGDDPFNSIAVSPDGTLLYMRSIMNHGDRKSHYSFGYFFSLAPGDHAAFQKELRMNDRVIVEYPSFFPFLQEKRNDE